MTIQIKELTVSKEMNKSDMSAVRGGDKNLGPPLINIDTSNHAGGGVAVLTYKDGSQTYVDVLGNEHPLPK
jgi:hypothetical protein